jgi:single-strand DNA-binding protein
MSSFNRVILLGNLTRDPQLKFLPNQTPVVEFGIATNRRYTTSGGEKKDEVTFVDVAFFGKAAEVISQWCQKGKALLVEGRLKYDSWEKDGQRRSKLSVIGDNFQFVGGRGEPMEPGEGSGEAEGDVGKALDAAPPKSAPARAGLPDAALAGGGRSRRPPTTDPLDGYQQHFEDSDIPF